MRYPVLRLITWVAVSRVADAASGFQAPLTHVLRWNPDDVFGGVYLLNMSIGTPPQNQTMLYDPDFPDIELMATGNSAALKSCLGDTPISSCSFFDNSTSSSFRDLGHDTFIYLLADPPDTGDYVSDVIEFGPGVKIRNQTMALTRFADFPWADLGLAGEVRQVGVREGLFPRYPSFLRNMVTQGIYASATFSQWLNPKLGPNKGITTFPDGKVSFGGLDTRLFDTKSLRTLPVTSQNDTSLVEPGEVITWSLAMTGLRYNHGPNLLRESIPCGLSAAATVLYIQPDIYQAVVNSFPPSVCDNSTLLCTIPCAERDRPHNTLTVTLSDPRLVSPRTSQPETNAHSFRFDTGPEQTIWTMDRMTKGGDPAKCSIAVFPADVATGTEQCHIGINMLKGLYVVYDLLNSEISVAQALPGGVNDGEVVLPIPAEGVSKMKFEDEISG